MFIDFAKMFIRTVIIVEFTWETVRRLSPFPFRFEEWVLDLGNVVEIVHSRREAVGDHWFRI